MSYTERNNMEYNNVSLENKVSLESLKEGTDERTPTSCDSDVRNEFRCHVDGEDGHRLEQLKTTLMDFMVNCLAEQPCDLIDYGIKFFKGMKRAQGVCDAAGCTDYGSELTTDDAHDADRADDADDADDVYDEGSDNGDADDSETDHSTSDVTSGTYVQFSSNDRRLAVLGELLDPNDMAGLCGGCGDDDEDHTVKCTMKSTEQRRALLSYVSGVFVFGALDVELMNEVVDAMYEQHVRKDDVVIRQDRSSHRFYVVETGKFRAYVTDTEAGLVARHRPARTYVAGDSFNEVELLYDKPSDVTVVAKSDGLLWILDRLTFRRIVQKGACDRHREFVALIESVSMLMSLTPNERMKLADALVPKYYQDGDLIMAQNDPGDGMYFVEEGVVGLFMTNDMGRQARASRIRKGGYFGELALITGNIRAASAYAEGPVKLAFLDANAFERMLGPCMDIMKRNIQNYQNKLATIFGFEHG